VNPTIDIESAGSLLRSAVDIADGCSDLADRRRALLECVAHLTGSDMALWAWTRARPQSGDLLAVGMITFNMSEDDVAIFDRVFLDADVQAYFHQGLQQYMERNKRVDGHWSVIIRNEIPQLREDPDHFISRAFSRCTFGPFLQAGRYSPGGAASMIDLFRLRDRPEYEEADRNLADLAFTNIPWLWANPDEAVPQDDVEALSPRQRAITFLLLDGLSRKKIASRLGIGEETVNHHMKNIFQHFGVQSAGELAALFLRRQ
jgi:DNA-binding CsgD family transcriptional regulator